MNDTLNVEGLIERLVLKDLVPYLVQDLDQRHIESLVHSLEVDYTVGIKTLIQKVIVGTQNFRKRKNRNASNM